MNAHPDQRSRAHLRVRALARLVIGRTAQACDWFIAQCDYMSDARWHTFGPVLTYGFRACEAINRAIDRATDNRRDWRGY